jgi:hypothetical protein
VDEYNQEDIRKGFQNLATLKQKNMLMQNTIDKLKLELNMYHAKEIGAAMVEMGFKNNEALAAISMLGRCVQAI